MAGTKTWADGDVVTSADLNGYVRDQWITVCTAGTRPTTTQEGRTIFETDTDRYYRWDGAAWQLVKCLGAWDTWTPAVTQGVTPTATVTNGLSIKEGRMARGTANIAFTTAGTAATRVAVPLPYAADNVTAVLGQFWYLDSGTTIYSGTVMFATTTTANLFVNQNGDNFGIAPAVTIANLDNLIIDLNYRSAS